MGHSRRYPLARFAYMNVYFSRLPALAALITLGLLVLGSSPRAAAQAPPVLEAHQILARLKAPAPAGTQLTVVNFWATWCKPCIQELIAIQDSYEDLVAETGVKLIAISIDDARNAAKVRPFVEGRAWEYEVYLDVNQDFKRALNVNNVPHTFLLDGNRMIVWDHNSYSPGDEEHLFELVRTLAAGKPLEEGH